MISVPVSSRRAERLKEAQVAQQFGVSRTTVRRAFESLLAEDWLVHNGKQGVKVTPLSMKQYKEMIELRACLDSFAARMAAVRRSSKASFRASKAHPPF